MMGLQRARDRARKIKHMLGELIKDPLSMPPAFAHALEQWSGDLVATLRADVDEPNVCDHCDGEAPPGKYLCSEACRECHQAAFESKDGRACVGICGKKQSRHSDGTLCREGVRQVPDNWQPCCEVFDDHTRTCTFDIRYEWFDGPEERGWRIAIDDSAGGGGIEISCCPHCGTRLP